MSPVVDPGWGEALRRFPMALLPTRGMRFAAGSTNGLTVMRVVWLSFTSVMVVLGIVVIAVDRGLPGGGVDGRLVAALVVGLGVFAQLLAPRVVPPITGRAMPAVRAAAQRAFFIRVALAEPAALLGFMGFVLSGNAAVYVAGFAVSMAGLWDAAPTAAWIDRGQQQLRESGSDVQLLDALVSGGLTR